MRLPSQFYPDIPTLTGEAMQLRAPRVADAAPFQRLVADPENLRFAPGALPALTYDWALREMTARMPDKWRRNTAASFIVASMGEASTCVGRVELALYEPGHEVASLSIMMAPAARRLRLTVEAVRLVCRFGFDQLGLARIEAVTGVHNRAAVYLGAHVGFTKEGILRGRLLTADGSRDDAYIGSVLPGDLR